MLFNNQALEASCLGSGYIIQARNSHSAVLGDEGGCKVHAAAERGGYRGNMHGVGDLHAVAHAAVHGAWQLTCGATHRW